MLRKSNYIILIIIILGIFLLIWCLSFVSIKTMNQANLNNYYDSYAKDNYYGVLKIDKLRIEKVIYNKNDYRNNVNKNVLLVNDEKNFIVLAAHSGNLAISYFKRLNELKIGDKIEFMIDGLTRTYELFLKDNVLKTGEVALTNYNCPILVLITCSKDKNNVQDIYYTRLVKSKKYV